MWFAITSIVFGAAIGLNVFALWLTDWFWQTERADGELRRSGGLIERKTNGSYCSAHRDVPATVQ